MLDVDVQRTMSATVDRRQQQRLALERANDTRHRRCELKRDVKAGRVLAPVVLLDPPEWLSGMWVFDLLVAMPRVGRSKALRLLSRLQITPSKPIGRLTVRQRHLLADGISRKGWQQ